MAAQKLLERTFRISPEQYERKVQTWLTEAAGTLTNFSALHRQVLTGADGEYEIDIAVRFVALYTPFLVLVECKRHRRSIERDVVQVLHDRVRATGAQKGLLFSTSTFQSGALTYAVQHGIGLIQLLDGDAIIMGRSGNPLPGEPLFPDRPDFFGLVHGLTPEGKRTLTSIGRAEISTLQELLGVSSAA